MKEELYLIKIFILYRSAISNDDCFSTSSEMLTHQNQMIFSYFEHCASYGGDFIVLWGGVD